MNFLKFIQKIFLGTIILFFFISSFAYGKTQREMKNLNQLTTITYLISNSGWLTYCNGEKMDSVAYQKTITHLISEKIPRKISSRQELIKTILIAASKKANLTKIINANKDFIQIKNGIASFSPIDGFAGVSIYLCAWKPLMEVNLKRFPEIKQINWSD